MVGRGGGSRGSGPCFDFQKGQCRRNNCRFSHQLGGGRGRRLTAGPRCTFKNSGFCNLGAQCPDKHDSTSWSGAAQSGTIRPAGASSATSNSSVAQSRRFLQTLKEAAVKPHQLRSRVCSAPPMWAQCWMDAAGNFSLKQLGQLVMVLSQVNANTHINTQAYTWKVAGGIEAGIYLHPMAFRFHFQTLFGYRRHPFKLGKLLCASTW